MTKNEAIKAIRLTSSGTIAQIIGSTKYEAIDKAYCRWILKTAKASDNAFNDCNNVWDVINTIDGRI